MNTVNIMMSTFRIQIIILIYIRNFQLYVIFSPGIHQKVGFADIEDFPSVVAIFHMYYTTDPPSIHHYGSGSIISPNYIITSADCVSQFGPDWYTVRAGTSFENSKKSSDHKIQKIIHHPAYKPGIPAHEIALLKLSEPIELDGKTKKVVKMFESTDKINLLSVAYTAGWGVEKTLGCEGIINKWTEFAMRSVELKFVSEDDCARIYKKPVCDYDRYFGIPQCRDFRPQEGEICAAVPGNELQHTSHGDYGGSVFVDGKLVGVTSRWGGEIGKNDVDFKLWPNIITTVSHYRDWIDRELNSK